MQVAREARPRLVLQAPAGVYMSALPPPYCNDLTISPARATKGCPKSSRTGRAKMGEATWLDAALVVLLACARPFWA